MLNPATPSFEQSLAQCRQKALDYIDQALADFISLFLSDGELDGAGPVEIKHYISAETAVVNDLLLTFESVLTLPSYERLAQICDEASCHLTMSFKETPFPNEGFILQRLIIEIKRD